MCPATGALILECSPAWNMADKTVTYLASTVDTARSSGRCCRARRRGHDPQAAERVPGQGQPGRRAGSKAASSSSRSASLPLALACSSPASRNGAGTKRHPGCPCSPATCPARITPAQGSRPRHRSEEKLLRPAQADRRMLVRLTDQTPLLRTGLRVSEYTGLALTQSVLDRPYHDPVHQQARRGGRAAAYPTRTSSGKPRLRRRQTRAD